MLTILGPSPLVKIPFMSRSLGVGLRASSMVASESFTTTNALVLDTRKFEVVVVSSTKHADVPVCNVTGHQLVSSTSAKC